MTVYVDDYFVTATVGRLTGRWCHMTADTTEELLEMAGRIGLRPQWIQHPGTWKEHFDVTAPRRQRAVAAGAVEVGARDSVRRMRARWDERALAAAHGSQDS